MLTRIALLTLLPLALASTSPWAATKADLADDPRAIAAGFLNFHPDLQYRGYGVDAYGKKDYARAMTLFRRAAHFADKPSQAMIGELYANGEGVPRDMAMAYAWMDLAAERGYLGFVTLRERYWKQMSAAERERALVEGQAVYEKFGNAAAKPRFATQLRRGFKSGVGSRTGFAGNQKINVPGPMGQDTIDGTTFKDIAYWDADKYWAMQDRIWRDPAGAKVRVGNPETLPEAPAASTRIPATRPDIDAPLPPVDGPGR